MSCTALIELASKATDPWHRFPNHRCVKDNIFQFFETAILKYHRRDFV